MKIDQQNNKVQWTINTVSGNEPKDFFEKNPNGCAYIGDGYGTWTRVNSYKDLRDKLICDAEESFDEPESCQGSEDFILKNLEYTAWILYDEAGEAGFPMMPPSLSYCIVSVTC